LTVWLTDEAIAAWRAEPRTTRGGQLWYSPLAILTALTLRTVIRLALRQTEGLVGSILHLALIATLRLMTRMLALLRRVALMAHLHIEKGGMLSPAARGRHRLRLV
jgi:hypothetical protein